MNNLPVSKHSNDPWIALIRALIGVCFLGLVLIKPSGEGWGRAWNLIAYWIFSAPAALMLASLYLWRQRQLKTISQGWDKAFLAAAFLYPLISIVAIKWKV